MTENRQDNIIDITINHLQSYYNDELTIDDANEIVSNLIGFSKLLLKLEEKRKLLLKNKE